MSPPRSQSPVIVPRELDAALVPGGASAPEVWRTCPQRHLAEWDGCELAGQEKDANRQPW